MEAEKPAGKRPRTKYKAAFRAEAVRPVMPNDQAATRVAQALGLCEALLGRWVPAARTQATRSAGSEALEQENKHLQAQLVRTERGILKKPKALTIFSQPTGRRNASLSLPYTPPAGPFSSNDRFRVLVPTATTPSISNDRQRQSSRRCPLGN